MKLYQLWNEIAPGRWQLDSEFDTLYEAVLSFNEYADKSSIRFTKVVTWRTYIEDISEKADNASKEAQPSSAGGCE